MPGGVPKAGDMRPTPTNAGTCTSLNLTNIYINYRNYCGGVYSTKAILCDGRTTNVCLAHC